VRNTRSGWHGRNGGETDSGAEAAGIPGIRFRRDRRCGRVIAVASEGDREIERLAESVITIPAVHEHFVPFLAVVPLQLLAYSIAVARGCNVDKPRNLAKSVTVE